jgi:hypothetical protein
MHNASLIVVGVVIGLVVVLGVRKLKAVWTAWRSRHVSLVERVEALEAKVKADAAAVIAKV